MGGKNVCHCPQPPGGTATCEPHQAAFCRVVNGVVDAGCADPPDVSGLAATAALQKRNNWALTLVTGIRRSPTDPVTSGDLQVLASKYYVNRAAGEEVRFALPWDVYTGAVGSGSSTSGETPGPVVGVTSEGDFDIEADAVRIVSSIFDVPVSDVERSTE